MRLIVLYYTCALALCLGSVPDAQAGPILDRVRERRAQRQGCQTVPGASCSRSSSSTSQSCAGCQSAAAAPAVYPNGNTPVAIYPNAPFGLITSPAPTVQLWGGTYYQTAPAVTSGCPTCSGGKCYAPPR